MLSGLIRNSLSQQHQNNIYLYNMLQLVKFYAFVAEQ